MMELKQRKRNRLKGYDYSKDGYYFLTLCTYNKEHILSKINTVGEGFPPEAFGHRDCG